MREQLLHLLIIGVAPMRQDTARSGIVFAVFAAVAAIGCGGTPASSSYEELVQGTWLAPCEHGTGYSMQSVQTNTGTNYETKRMSFETEDCTGTAVVARTYRGPFLIGPEIRVQRRLRDGAPV